MHCKACTVLQAISAFPKAVCKTRNQTSQARTKTNKKTNKQTQMNDPNSYFAVVVFAAFGLIWWILVWRHYNVF